jgi:ureidoglycolate lyase
MAVLPVCACLDWLDRRDMIIRPEPLTREVFRPFGEVLETDGSTPELINQGHTQKFADLASITSAEGGRVQISIYRSSAIELPFRISMLERHPLGSQAFMPLHNRPFPVIVALPDSIPGPDTIRAFLSNGRQGVNIHAGVWHHYQLTLDEDSDYLVVDRATPGENCDTFRLHQELVLSL